MIRTRAAILYQDAIAITEALRFGVPQNKTFKILEVRANASVIALQYVNVAINGDPRYNIAPALYDTAFEIGDDLPGAAEIIVYFDKQDAVATYIGVTIVYDDGE
ncbi:MAG: hypothetical protein WC294_09965 [Methanoregula sp.]|jgi:hypothetical protein